MAQAKDNHFKKMIFQQDGVFCPTGAIQPEQANRKIVKDFPKANQGFSKIDSKFVKNDQIWLNLAVFLIY